MLKKYSLIIPIFCALICSACFSEWKGDEGIVSISIGDGNAGSRQAAWLDEIDNSQIKHTITFESPGLKTISDSIEPDISKRFSLMPGYWDISVIAEKVCIDGDFEYRTLIAKGSESNKNIIPGPNENINIKMKLVSDIDITFDSFEIKFMDLQPDNSPIEIYYSDIEGKEIELLNPQQYDRIEWRCKGIIGKGDSFILNWEYVSFSGDDGYIFLVIEVLKENKPYSKTIIFKVIYEDEGQE